MKKSLVVAIIGKPNAGKSTLLNQIMGQKISIVTHKVQTTRRAIRGVLNVDQCQIIFLDTPGLFQPNNSRKLEQFIVLNAKNALNKVDLVILLIAANDTNIKSSYQEILKIIKNGLDKSKVVIVINKIDLLVDKEMMEMLDFLAQENLDVIKISGKDNINIDKLISFLQSKAKSGDWLFDEEDYTDITEKQLAEDITLEEIYLILNEELPYSIKIETDQWLCQDDNSIKVYQSIITAKSSHKNIIIGENGKTIKKIGERARKQISDLIDKKVHLFLYVKVRNDWINKLKTT